MNLAEWLRGLGLEQYALAFRDNDIDEAILRRLKAEDLRELGVVSVGHRRRLLDAIAALDEPPPPGSEALASEPRANPADPDRRGEVAANRSLGSSEPLGSGTAPLIGRKKELDLLLRYWQRAKSSDGSTVLIAGEAGIGKSRLAAELTTRIGSEPHLRLRLRCSPRRQASALYPVIAHLERAAGFERRDTDAQKLDKLAALLAAGSPGADERALIAELLSLPNSAADLDRSPQRKRQRLFEAFLNHVASLAQHQPLLVVFEDVQWIDPTSRELLDLMVEQIPSMPVLLLVTCAAEFEPTWTEQPHVGALALNRLGGRDAAILAQRAVKNGGIAGNLAAEIARRAEGVPLIIEQLAKAAIESADRQDGLAGILAAGSGPNPAVPAMLHAALSVRFDRLGVHAREVAQIAAVLGRRFQYGFIRHVAPRAELDETLDQLTEAGLLRCRGMPSDSSYRFNHSLIRDAIYATLSPGRRRELHSRAAAVLEQWYPDVAERQPEILADHLSTAGTPARAVEYWFRAGERAKRRSADREAIAHLRAALSKAEELPDSFERAAWELRISIALGPALMTTTSSAAPEVARVYARARRLAEESGRSIRLFQALWGSWLASFSAGDLRTTGGLVDELFALAREQRGPELMLQAHHAGWTTAALLQGDLRAAQRSLESGMRLYRPEVFEHHALLYGGHDPGVCGHAIAGMVSALLGRLDRAVTEAREALALSRRLAHHGSLAHAYQFATEAYYLRRDAAGVSEIAREMLPFARDHGSALVVANAKIFQGWALAATGHVEEGLALLREGLAAWRRTGSKLHGPYRLSRIADGLLVAGEAAEAAALLAEATALARETGEHWSDPELDRLSGIAILRQSRRPDDVEQAEYALRRAIAGARERGARLIELRAAASLARLLAEAGRGAEAKESVGRIYSWFTEGFEAADLKEARALLSELG